MRTFISILSLITFVCAERASAQTTNYQAYALFVVNIAKYSEFPQTQGDLEIVAFGKSKAYDELAKQHGKIVNGRHLKISQTDDLSALGTASVIYVADGKSNALSDLLKATAGKPIVIICEREGLFKKGAGMSFVITENNTLRFDLNNGELQKRQIKVAKNLTTLAHTVL